MANSNPRRPILYKGELLISPITKKGGPNKEPKTTYEEARTKLLTDIDKAESALRALPQQLRLPNESVVCLKMHPDFSAKTYYPNTLFTLENVGFKEVGSRLWREEGRNEQKSLTTGKLLFIRVFDDSLNNFKKVLNQAESSLPKGFIRDVRRLSSFELLQNEDKILGFDNDWQNGTLEVVLHPFSTDRELVLSHFTALLTEVEIDTRFLRTNQYTGGITFLSLKCNRADLYKIASYNPLRTIHPLNIREFGEVVRGSVMAGAPTGPQFSKKPSIYVGVFDGGMITGNPYLDNYTEVENIVNEPAIPLGLQHGTDVTSSVLYGPINDYKNNTPLPEPQVSVKNFRVISDKNITDADLYEIIDAIEETVPKHPDVKVFNLSIGPASQILDDDISRFTFVCDHLSYKHNVLFCAAVGNAGEQIDYNRIQAPSDMVNGLAIGAYTKANGKIERAAYSCIGPGREGNKMKPDLLAFGGCNKTPINLLSHQMGYRSITAGTSFASPYVAGIAAQLIGKSNKVISALIARALLIHSTHEVYKAQHTNDLGFGVLPDNINSIVTCPDKSFTLIYQGELEADKYVEFEIPWVDGISGKTTFTWTAVILTDTDSLSPDDYTSTSVETSFYPNANVYNFTKQGETPKRVNVVENPDKVQELLNDGYKQSAYPVSNSNPPSFAPERELRKDLKWDSVDCRTATKQSEKIVKPVFHVHAMRRGVRSSTSKVKFAFVLSVQTPKATVDIYSKVVTKYSALTPIKIDVQNIVKAGV